MSRAKPQVVVNDAVLFPTGIPSGGEDRARLFDLYKMMVTSSEALVERRQGVNTFFLTINGALLTAIGLVLTHKAPSVRLQAMSVAVLTLTGMILSLAWRSLIRSFGQLNSGKFAVINRIEEAALPASIYLAEWKALDEGRNPSKYRTFTSREVWTPVTLIVIHSLATGIALIISLGWWTP